MGDIKLFRMADDVARELPPRGAQVERSLQLQFETNLEALLGVRFLASEFSTGVVHGGRIDTLGIDENGSPVIIEYKRALNENVVSQGLFYLDWLLDHRREFQWLVLEKLGHDVASTVEWSSPRLLCIAGDFTRYDLHAVKQIARSIELMRYRRFGDDLLMVDLVHAPQAPPRSSAKPEPALATQGDADVTATAKDPYLTQRIDHRLSNAPAELRDLWDAVCALLHSLGDDVQTKQTKYYLAFKRIKNFVCLEIHLIAGAVTAYLKIDPTSVVLEPGFTRDVRQIGHCGTGNLEVVMRSKADVIKAQGFFGRAYDEN